jgi:hypothetical protein
MNTISNNPTNASGADAAIPNFDAAVIGADIKAKVSEADRLLRPFREELFAVSKAVDLMMRAAEAKP